MNGHAASKHHHATVAQFRQIIKPGWLPYSTGIDLTDLQVCEAHHASISSHLQASRHACMHASISSPICKLAGMRARAHAYTHTEKKNRCWRRKKNCQGTCRSHEGTHTPLTPTHTQLQWRQYREHAPFIIPVLLACIGLRQHIAPGGDGGARRVLFTAVWSLIVAIIMHGAHVYQYALKIHWSVYEYT